MWFARMKKGELEKATSERFARTSYPKTAEDDDEKDSEMTHPTDSPANCERLL
jgi:hypothetical protein